MKSVCSAFSARRTLALRLLEGCGDEAPFVVNVGCGTCEWPLAFARRRAGARVLSVDNAANGVAALRARGYQRRKAESAISLFRERAAAAAAAAAAIESVCLASYAGARSRPASATTCSRPRLRRVCGRDWFVF